MTGDEAEVQFDDQAMANKYDCYSPFEHSPSYKNPFKIEIMISGILNKALIDTGADVSLIDAKLIPKTCTIRKDKLLRIFSANGN